MEARRTPSESPAPRMSQRAASFVSSLSEKEAARPLQALTNLKSLNLIGAPITDAGLGRLHRLKGLASLKLVNTQVTAAGVHQLKEILQDWSNSDRCHRYRR